jgi:2-succinyl-6-hydroxy-2,4-cyclohexadiene-1-carboxylate synthase
VAEPTDVSLPPGGEDTREARGEGGTRHAAGHLARDAAGTSLLPAPEGAGCAHPRGGGWARREWGAPGAPVLVLLHGFGGDARLWAGLAPAFVDLGYRVLAFDLPGHGGTPAPAPGTGLAEAAAALGATLDGLGVDRPTVLGYSLGGRLALHLALARPLAHLVLVGASAGLADPAAREARVAADAAWSARLAEGLPGFLAAWDAQEIFATRRAMPAPDRAAADAVRAEQDPAGLAAAMDAFGLGRQAALHDRLPALATPVVLVAGEADPKFRGLAAEMAALLPHATVVTAPGAGHDVPLERPATLIEAVARLTPLKGALR